MDVRKEIILLTDVLNISENDLADAISVSFLSINNWKNNHKTIDESNINKLYNFAYSKGIYFNQIYEQLLKEENTTKDNIVLFHGAKKQFSLPIDYKTHSKSNNDFGSAFYLGENLKQAATYICNSKYNYVYSFKLDLNDLRIIDFSVDKKWMLAIAYYRGWLEEYKNSNIIQEIINEINNADLIIAPIADNRMFDIIGEFAEGSITDKQCKHALAATNLGNQYVIKSVKAINKLSLLKELFISSNEKEELIKSRFDLANTGFNKVKMARIEYRGKGKYIEELLK